ncbi:MAG TPA: hypothetical protein DCX07_01560 [Phycisphaerales bacterium]|nr:hypothetical protein [Phycisphaerales bacterium]
MCGSSHSARNRGEFQADVVSNERLCPEHYLLRLRAAEFPPTLAGQFVQLQCRRLGEQDPAREVPWPAAGPPRLTQAELAGREPFLRRPFSLAGRRDTPAGVELDLIYRTVGTGTHWLAEVVRPGQRLSVLGPLGNGFAVRADKPRAALIGGGVGIPPMIYLAETLARAGKQSVAFHGARTAALLPVAVAGDAVSPAGRPTPCVEPFARADVPSVVATDDGSLGFAGMVSRAFESWLDAERLDPSSLAVYSCGPEPMMRAVAELCLTRGIDCQLCMERHMACGMGTCQSCVVKIRDDTPQGWSFKLCCTDGPVFEAGRIVWA